MKDNKPRPDISKAHLIKDLTALGVTAGDTLMVHSSLSSIGYVEGGPDTVIDALLEVLTSSGTLMFPSFQGGGEFDLLQKGCVFDLKTSPSEHGLLTETFRLRAGVLRSASPTHSVAAIGKNAAAILADHDKCTVSTGRGSPFEKLVRHKAKILLLGVTHASNTMLHYLENTNGAPTVCMQLFRPIVINLQGQARVVPSYPHMPGLRRRYERVEDELLAEGTQRNGLIGQALSRLVDAARMAKSIGEKIKNDPLYLIEVFTP